MINKNTNEGNFYIHEQLSKIIDEIKSDNFKEKHNFEKNKIKYINWVFFEPTEDSRLIFIKNNNFTETFKASLCEIQFTFNSIFIEKINKKYTYRLTILKEKMIFK